MALTLFSGFARSFLNRVSLSSLSDIFPRQVALDVAAPRVVPDWIVPDGD